MTHRVSMTCNQCGPRPDRRSTAVIFSDDHSSARSPHSILACGHTWDGTEPWADMAVILKETIDGPDGPRPGVSVGHHCQRCRPLVKGERLPSLEEAWAWLREVGVP